MRVHKGDDGKSYVTVVQNGQQVEREITIGLKNDTYAEVKSGLEAGEIVVTDNGKGSVVKRNFIETH